MQPSGLLPNGLERLQARTATRDGFDLRKICSLVLDHVILASIIQCVFISWLKGKICLRKLVHSVCRDKNC